MTQKPGRRDVDPVIQQTVGLSAEVLEAITDALADALLADLLSDQAATVSSPGGTHHPEAA